MRKKGLLILGLVMVLVLPLVAACTPTPAPSPAPAPAPAPPTTVTVTPAPSPAPTTGLTGELVVAVDILGRESWIPSIGGWVDQNLHGITNEFLVMNGLDPKFAGVPQPGGLAESWDISADGLTYDIYLRKGIQFNEGWGEFTAEDVKFTIELSSGEASNSNQAVSLRKIESVTVVDPHHLRVVFPEPDLLFLHYMSNYFVSQPIVSKKHVEAVGEDAAARHPVGTGPWVFKEHKVGEYIKYEAVENHWRKTPEFKNLTVRLVPEETTRLAMLKTGEVDIINMGISSKADVVATAGLKVVGTPVGTYMNIQFGGMVLPEREGYDPTVPWVDGDDPASALKVRQALNLAIDKEAIVEHIFMGEAERTTMRGFKLGSAWEDPSWELSAYDPERAKQLLAEAGYPDGFELTLLLYTKPGRTELPAMGEAVAMNWEAIGLTVNRLPTEGIIMLDRWATRDVGWEVMVEGGSPNPEPWTVIPAVWHTDAYANYGYESYEMQALVDKASQTPDFDERVKLTRQAFDFFYREVRLIPIAQKSVIYGVGPRVGEFEQVPLNNFINSFEYATQVK